MEVEPKELLDPGEFYDNMAPYYDRFIESTRYNTLSLEEEEKFIESFIKDKTMILDLGCGTGRTMKLLSSVRRGLVGIDISRKMIEIFRVLRQGGLILLDTPHGVVRGAKYMITWPAGNRIIHAIGFGKNKDEILKALNRVGFGQIRFFGAYGGYSELQDDSRRIIVCATKDVGLTK